MRLWIWSRRRRCESEVKGMRNAKIDAVLKKGKFKSARADAIRNSKGTSAPPCLIKTLTKPGQAHYSHQQCQAIPTTLGAISGKNASVILFMSAISSLPCAYFLMSAFIIICSSDYDTHVAESILLLRLLCDVFPLSTSCHLGHRLFDLPLRLPPGLLGWRSRQRQRGVQCMHLPWISEFVHLLFRVYYAEADHTQATPRRVCSKVLHPLKTITLSFSIDHHAFIHQRTPRFHHRPQRFQSPSATTTPLWDPLLLDWRFFTSPGLSRR